MSAIQSKNLTPGPPPASGWRAAGLRYYKYSHFLNQRFGKRVWRVSVDGGFTCPNVDGTVAIGGCVYCDNRSFSPARRMARAPVAEQIDKGIAVLSEKYAARDYLAYFQAATNTHGPLARLESLFTQALAHPRILGLIVATRPDSLPDDCLDLLERLAAGRYVSLEIGLQSIHDASLAWMNRGHDAGCFFDAVSRAQGRGLDLVAHVILGLPGESREDMLATARAIAAAPIQGVKIHNLHVIEGTPLAESWRRGEVPLLEREEYIDLLIEFLELLPPELVIHRLTGDAPSDYLLAPLWVQRKAEFLHRLQSTMSDVDTFQGRRA